MKQEKWPDIDRTTNPWWRSTVKKAPLTKLQKRALNKKIKTLMLQSIEQFQRNIGSHTELGLTLTLAPKPKHKRRKQK